MDSTTCRNCGQPIHQYTDDYGQPENDWYHPDVILSETEFEDRRYCIPSDETLGRAEP